MPVGRPAHASLLVCVVGLRGLPDVMGGVESHCQHLLPRIAAMAPELAIEVIARRPYVPLGGDYHGVRVTPLAAPRQASSEAIVSTLIGILHARRRRAKLVHIHAVGPALLAPLARRLGMRVVFTHHGADYDRAKWGRMAKAMLRLGERLGVTSADAVIAVAPSLAAHLKRRYPRHAHKIHHVPNGRPEFPQEGDPELILERLGLTANDFILAVGRLVPEKGFDALIEANRAGGSKRQLVIVGGADHASRYSQALLAQAGPDVIFAGIQPHHVLHQLYRSAALFVLPSLHEGLPISALEAGSLGCPTLLSDIEPNRDIGLPARNYFPAGDRAALAALLGGPFDRFAVDPQHFDRFDWGRIAAATLAIYRSALADR